MVDANKVRAASYCRISTLNHGQDITNQLEPIRQFCQARGFELLAEYSDEGISGATERRKGLDSLLLDARKGKFKTVVVVEISRLARDVRHLLNLLHELNEIGVSVVSIREGIDFNSTMGKAMVSMIGILMQVEKDLLKERIKSALAVKKLTAEKTGNGWRSGRPTKVTPALEQEIINLRKSGLSIRQIARKLSISKTSVLRVTQKGGLDDDSEQ